MKDKNRARIKRHFRVRKHMTGSAEKPRLAVFRSAKHVYVQAIDDLKGNTLASASSLVKELPQIEGEVSGKQKVAKAVGKLIAQKLQEKGITTVVFDRGGFLYHGRVAAVADGAREGGLNF